MEIARGVHLISVKAPTFMGTYAPNVYLVVGQRAAFIDSGFSDDWAVEDRLDYLRKIGAPAVEYVILTHSHPDHAGGSAKLKASTGAKVVTHRLAKAAVDNYFPDGIDGTVKEGDLLDLGGLSLEVIHTPGHNSGHICLYLKEERILFSGDHILGMGTTVISCTEGDMGEYIESLRKLLVYDISRICPGHGPLIREPRRKLLELIEHRLERERQVLDCLQQGKVTVEEMVQEIYPELDQRLLGMATEQVLSHLAKLEKEEKVAARPIGGRAGYALK